MNKFTKGQKVKIPTTKSVQCRIHESGTIKKAKELGQDYLVVKYYDGEQCVVALSMSEGGDFFLESDLEAYPEFKKGDKVKIPTRKTTGISLDEIKDEIADFPYLFIINVDNRGGRVTISEDEGDITGYTFKAKDLELYVEPKFKKGDKVEIPTQKTGKYPGIENSSHVKRAKAEGKDHMYIVEYRKDGLYVLNKDEGMTAGDFFHERDLVLYEEEPLAPFFYPTDSSEPFFQPFLTVPFDPPTPSTVTYKGVDLGEKLEDIDADIKHIVREIVETQERLQKLEKTPVAVSMHTKEAGSSVKHVYLHEITKSLAEADYRVAVTFNNGKRMELTFTLSAEEQEAIFQTNGTITGYVRKLFK